MYTAAVITVSDKCADGRRADAGGPLVSQMLRDAGFDVVYTSVTPDEKERIALELTKCADELDAALAVTTGGTGFSPRDVTPEATLAVCERMAPGIPEAMRAAGMKSTNRAMLARQQAGIRGRTLIINLPGSLGAIRENLDAALPALEHGLEMLREPLRDH
ncbi:MAG: MogA/MoaB family molybdenum cofactor biosynthesis protein [Oscillospiraceae bacterium]|jgi:molybdenum cofactor synthesis domain-containing protein|nr:MogA/MoaB family molybdenum cofactor biosynthesis protein [Oscillospiraceae bacterium]